MRFDTVWAMSGRSRSSSGLASGGLVCPRSMAVPRRADCRRDCRKPASYGHSPTRLNGHLNVGFTVDCGPSLDCAIQRISAGTVPVATHFEGRVGVLRFGASSPAPNDAGIAIFCRRRAWRQLLGDRPPQVKLGQLVACAVQEEIRHRVSAKCCARATPGAPAGCSGMRRTRGHARRQRGEGWI